MASEVLEFVDNKTKSKTSNSLGGKQVNIIPSPEEIRYTNDSGFEITSQTKIVAAVEYGRAASILKAGVSEITGYLLEDGCSDIEDDVICIRSNESLEHLGEEGYKLKVLPNSIKIEAFREAGAFYAIQSLKQLLPVDVFAENKGGNLILPSVEIVDRPRFGWRGIHLDVSRHFMSLDFIKRLLDLMSAYKLNKFHWHLVDDQGWRIEIKKYPKLTEVGAWRNRTKLYNSNESSYSYEDELHGGFYTQQQIAEIVQYAKERFIEVIPEIEMPGHVSSAIAAYPWLSCNGKQIDIPSEWGIFSDVYCAGNEQVYKFNEDVLREIMDLFPCEYIHIGGDEVKKDNWKQCSKCAEKMEAEGLNDYEELQSYFVERMGRFLQQHNRKMIGWDEILSGKHSFTKTIMAWRDYHYGEVAAKRGYDVIMSPQWTCYFDYGQSFSTRMPRSEHYTPLESVYSYDPIPENIGPEHEDKILGVQANVWTEWMRNHKDVERMIWPRAFALAEIAWHKAEKKNFDEFLAKLNYHCELLSINGVEFFKDMSA